MKTPSIESVFNTFVASVALGTFFTITLILLSGLSFLNKPFTTVVTGLIKLWGISMVGGFISIIVVNVGNKAMDRLHPDNLDPLTSMKITFVFYAIIMIGVVFQMRSYAWGRLTLLTWFGVSAFMGYGMGRAIQAEHECEDQE